MTVQHNTIDGRADSPDEIMLALARAAYSGRCCVTMLELAVVSGLATVDDDPREARGRARAALGRARRAGHVVTMACCEPLNSSLRLRVVTA